MPDDDDSSHFSADVDGHHTVLSRLDHEAYETDRKAYDEGQAILKEVRSGDVIGDNIMGDETAHLKRATTQMQNKNDNNEGHEEKKNWV
jgi:hypothetical protein